MEQHTNSASLTGCPFCITIIIAIIMSSCINKTPADLIVHNAKIYTVDADFSMADAFAVKDGKFVAVGNENDILPQYDAEEVIDAQGQAVYPGFMDGHSHFTGYGENLVRWADLKGCQSYDEVIERLKVHDTLDFDRLDLRCVDKIDRGACAPVVELIRIIEFDYVSSEADNIVFIVPCRERDDIGTVHLDRLGFAVGKYGRDPSCGIRFFRDNEFSHRAPYYF